MKRIYPVIWLAVMTAMLSGSCQPEVSRINPNIDWPPFMARQDPVWKVLPSKFDHGAFLGNGLLGTTIFADDDSTLRFEIGRSDVTDHRRDNGRLPVGGMLLKTAGKIQSGTLRTDLWNAEVRGEIKTGKGGIRFRAMNHAIQMALLVDIETTGEEQAAAFVWEPKKAEVFRDKMKNITTEPNPEPQTGKDGNVGFCEQRRVGGGTFTTAWIENGTPEQRRLTLTIADSWPGMTSKTEALSIIRRVSAMPSGSLEKSHRDWWHAYYPESFISVPDAQIEGYYWNQIYKLACATRQDRQVIDLLGPWYRQTGWPRIWWNLNIQLAYSPVYTANRLELGESFTRFIDARRDNFVRNAREIWGLDSCATVPHTTDYEGLRGNGTAAPNFYINPGDFTWGLHLYWQQYRFSMDDSFITDRKQHAFFDLLKGSVNLYLHLLQKGDDGKLHLPELHSPEYGSDADNNYNLSLLRWACRTLLDLNERYAIKDSQKTEWERILTDLVPYPQDENGFRIGKNVSFTNSHRHWSHILMVWPLHILSTEQPENEEIVRKSVTHWLTVGNGAGIQGWSKAVASALYATLRDGDHALTMLRGHHNSKSSVMPNTQYIEGSPVIECGIVAAEALQEMLIQSWGGVIRIFPAVPAKWKEAVFHDLRTEGAFLISAVRKEGKTRWVRIKSLAGEACVIHPGFEGEFRLSDTSVGMRKAKPGYFELELKKGDEVILYQDKNDLTPVEPCIIPAEEANFWGLKTN